MSNPRFPGIAVKLAAPSALDLRQRCWEALLHHGAPSPDRGDFLREVSNSAEIFGEVDSYDHVVAVCRRWFICV